MQMFVIEAYKGKVFTSPSVKAKETEKMFIIEWDKKASLTSYASRLNKEKEYALNVVGEAYSMWGRDNGELIKRFREAMNEVLKKEEIKVSHIKSYIKEAIAFPAHSAKPESKAKKPSLKIVKFSKV